MNDLSDFLLGYLISVFICLSKSTPSISVKNILSSSTFIEDNDSHLKNAEASIFAILSGIVTEVKELQ